VKGTIARPTITLRPRFARRTLGLNNLGNVLHRVWYTATDERSANSAQVIYGHITYPYSDNEDGKQCVSAVAATSDEDDNDNGTTGLNGSSLALRDCVYDLESSIDQGQYWRMLLIYGYPVVYLVTASK